MNTQAVMIRAIPSTGRFASARSLLMCAVVAVGTLALGIADADAASRGGRGGGGGNANRGAMANTSVSGADRGGGYDRSSVNGGQYDRSNVNTGNYNKANVNTGNVNTGNVNKANINTGNVNHNDVNVNIDGGYHGYAGYGRPGYVYHPIAAGVAIGAMAVTTAAIVGSYYRTLPPSCTVVIRNGTSYHYCGSVYYQQTWSGNDVVYVVVNP